MPDPFAPKGRSKAKPAPAPVEDAPIVEEAAEEAADEATSEDKPKKKSKKKKTDGE